MQLVELRLTKFKSFIETTHFTFRRAPGLYFLQGINEVEPRLGSNGAGKTSIWDAVTWVLMNKTSKGIRAGDVCNWGHAKGTIVDLDFKNSSGQIWTVRRTWGPNSWRLQTDVDEVDLTEDNADLLGLQLDFTSWLHCVLMAQRVPMFLDLQPTAKAELFSDILKLSKWIERSTAAGKRADVEDGKLRRIEAELAEHEGILEELRSKSTDYSALARDWQDTHDRRWTEIQRIHKDALEQRKKLVADLASAVKVVDETRAAIKAWQPIADGARSKMMCPECGQRLPVDTKAQQAYAEADKAQREMELELRTAVSRESDLNNALQYIDRDLDRIEDSADMLSKEQSPFANLQQQNHQRMSDLENDRLLLWEDKEHTEYTHVMAKQWSQSFKDIRLLQINEALMQLEIEVNSCVMQLGLVNWQLQFAVDGTTKKGTVTRGFNVLVLSPQNKDPVPWEAWSGGEAQRLRLATTMGLSNLIRARTGTDISIEVWDEPTQDMSDQGITDLLDCLSERAAQEQRQIWLVDHKTLGYGGFAGTATVVKDQQGSRVIDGSL